MTKLTLEDSIVPLSIYESRDYFINTLDDAKYWP